MTTTDHADRQDSAESWLTSAAAPGRAHLRRAAAWTIANGGFTVSKWAGTALVADGLLSAGSGTLTAGLCILPAAAALEIVSATAASRAQDGGHRAIADQIRADLTDALLPVERQPNAPEPGSASLVLTELVDDVADYHARALPTRLASPAIMLMVLLAAALALWPSAVLLLLSTALMPINMRLAGLFAREGADRQLQANQRLHAVILDSFRGMDTLRNLGAVERRAQVLQQASDRLVRSTMTVLKRAFVSALVMDVVITFSIAADATYIGLSLLGYVHIPAAQPLTLFNGVFVLLLCPMYFSPLRSMTAAFHDRERAVTAGKAIIDMTRSVRPRLPQTRTTLSVRTVRPVSQPVGVELTGVTMRFDGDDHDVLRIDDLHLPAGAWTAVTGPSGSGKTTFLSLVAGSRSPTTGRVAWTTPHRRNPPTLGACAWIGQQSVLLDATVADNIRVGRPAADDSEVEVAARDAGLLEVVAGLADGFDTVLGEGGHGISTGEARRIAIARALLRNTRLWVLDEPTAHLDAGSEQGIIAALRRATSGATVVVATHSPQLAAAADVTYALDQGKVRVPRIGHAL
jgi:ATP-binding cassette subfamily C protein CydD